MSIDPEVRQKIIELLHINYPGLDGLEDPRFQDEEITYKQNAVKIAQDLLDEKSLMGLLEANDVKEFISRLIKVSGTTNLLYLSTPSTGDLRTLYNESLDSRELCQQIFALLYGDEPSPVRLETWVNFLESNGIRPYWTFPTYFLFLTHPETDLFVKPESTRFFLQLVGREECWSAKPSAEAYRCILDMAGEVALSFGGVQVCDMLHVQSLIWVTHRFAMSKQSPAEKPDEIHSSPSVADRAALSATQLAQPFSRLFLDMEEAEAAFDFLHGALQLLGVHSADDERVAITFPSSRGGNVLRLDYGQWMVIDIRGPDSYADKGINLALRKDLVDASAWSKELTSWEPFDTSEGEDAFCVYELPWMLPEDMDRELLSIYEQSLREVGTRFAHWQATPYRRANNPDVLVAIFDSGKRYQLLTEGVKAMPVTPPQESIANHFQGISPETFRFFQELRANNSKEWFDENRWRYEVYIRDTLRSLMLDVGQAFKPKVDPYLSPDALEVEPKTPRTVIRINKRFPDEQGPYKDHYWSAFFRESLSKQVDAQLFMIIWADNVEIGLHFGDNAQDIRDQFKQRVMKNPSGYLRLLNRLSITSDFNFQGDLPDSTWEEMQVSSEADLVAWLELAHIKILRRFSEDDPTIHSPEFADMVYEDLRRVFPFFLLATVDDPEPKIEQYLSAEYPDESDGSSTILPTLVTDGAFTAKAFELLSGLHQNPKRTYYNANKDAFAEYIEGPFKALLQAVVERLPESITEIMETEKHIFSRFLKNDFGQGGAWDYYWGALYPTGFKRISHAQLSLWMNHERLEYGFYIGDYGTEPRRRFIRNSTQHGDALRGIFAEMLTGDDRFYFGGHENFDVSPEGELIVKSPSDWQSFFRDPESHEFDVSVILTKNQVLSYSSQELTQTIAQTFQQLFPLVLLAIEDDPMPAIASYLGQYIEPVEDYELNEEYALSQIADETGFDRDLLSRWVRAIERKGQAIFYGPPGTGKTFVAEKLAQHLIGTGERDGFVDLVQFHPAYAYEDFMQGIRPESDGKGLLTYPVKPGRFLNFISEARKRKGTSVLIIDEINRANLARVFGELMYLLEYRDKGIPLAGGGTLRIPKQVRIIGTMNTADRSIALVDHALRRRFAFLALQPDYDVLRHYHHLHATGFAFERLIDQLEKLNRDINDHHYEVGISYFLREDLEEQIEDIWRMEIEPYLEEYFFDQPEKAASYRWEKLRDRIMVA